MEAVRRVQGPLGGAVRLAEVLRAMVVQSVRHETGRSPLGFLAVLARPLILLGVFYAMIELAGARGLAIRGSTTTFLLTGIFCFLVHVSTLQKVAQAARRARGLLFHAPASLLVIVLAQALGALYVHALAAAAILGVAGLAGVALEIRDPAGLVVPWLLAWASGLGIGMILMGLGQVAPGLADGLSLVYTRVQFFTSGKFWAANIVHMVLPADWLAEVALANPLLHIIDQCRGAAFVNYFPKYTNLAYPAAVTFVLLLLGLMVESRMRRGFSLSRARR